MDFKGWTQTAAEQCGSGRITSIIELKRYMINMLNTKIHFNKQNPRWTNTGPSRKFLQGNVNLTRLSSVDLICSLYYPDDWSEIKPKGYRN